MKTRISLVKMLALALMLPVATMMVVAQSGAGRNIAPPRPVGPCDIYAADRCPCVAAHSTTRALYASYNGPLYQVMRQSDGKTLDIGVVQPSASPVPDAGGYADAAAQDAFCANTVCWITTIYDQSGNGNHLVQAPRGGFSGPAMGGFNNIPIADMAPITIMGHKAYGVFIEPGMGLRWNDAKGTAVDDQAEGQYWVISGHHYNSGCCFDYGNAETDSRDDGNATMETTYFGNAPYWYHGNPPGPWIMTDQENNLVGCVNLSPEDKLCPDLPNIAWRFVTAMADGEPHHWRSMGGDAQKGVLSVVFDGPRVDYTYDPMRKQGAILLGNGGDNSNGSQGTFYEGAMTAPGTFPTQETNQKVQANIVAAKYDVQRLSLAPANATVTPPGLQTFSPRSSQNTTLTFTNTTGAPVKDVKLSISVPKGWTSVVSGSTETSKAFTDPVAPGASVSATFEVTSGPAAFNGDLLGNASWMDATSGQMQSETTNERVRNVSPIKINEFRISAARNATNSFIELHNAGESAVDISNWTLTHHPTQEAIFSSVKIPAGTKLPARGFYLLGLSNSGLAVPAKKGESTIYVRGVTDMSVDDTIEIDAGSAMEICRIAGVGAAAGARAPDSPFPFGGGRPSTSGSTTVWQPLPDGPVITIPAGSNNVPVTSVTGFEVGQKIGIGYGATYPTVANSVEKYEVVTVTAVGKPGTQAWLAADAKAGDTNIKVTSVANISVGDKIRLDIASVSHGIETVTVTRVGTEAGRAMLAADASAGAANIVLRTRGRLTGFTGGDKMTVGTPANQETVTITTVQASGPDGSTVVDFAPVLARAHSVREDVVAQGTGLDLAAPLRFNHAANIPFSARGTGISFEPVTAFAHSSNEPVLPLGTGITLDRPLAKNHEIHAVVRDAKVTTAGYQGTPAPNQWFGGPVLSSMAGNMVLRDAAGHVVDSQNYGGLVDPWATEGYQASSGAGESGCFVPAPTSRGGFGFFGLGSSTSGEPNLSAGRFPDGLDTDSNCADFLVQSSASLSTASLVGAINIKVTSVAGFDVGQKIVIDAGANLETAVIAKVGTAGGTTVDTVTNVGATVIRVSSVEGFSVGQTITIDSGANRETAVVASVTRGRRAFGGFGGRDATMTVGAPLKFAHARDAQVSGSGITLTTPLTLAHDSGALIVNGVPTPGAPNQYYSRHQ